MSNQKNAEANTPIFQVQKLYVKDLSFEGPNSPQIFSEKTTPNAKVEMSVGNTQLNEDQWEVAISATVSVTSGDKVIFIIEIEHAGIFLLKNIPEEILPRLLAVDCPTVIFPFTRQIIAQTALDGGFMPIMLDPMNFMAMHEKRTKETIN